MKRSKGGAQEDLWLTIEVEFLRLVKSARAKTVNEHEITPPAQSRDPETKARVDFLYKLIEKSLTPLEGSTTVHVQHLERRLYLRHIVFGTSIARALALIDRVRDATRELHWEVVSCQNSEAWNVALVAAAEIAALLGMSLSFAPSPDDRTSRVARAGLELRREGFAVALRGTDISVSEPERVRIANRIKYLIGTNNARSFLERLLSAAATTYDHEQQRYHLVRHVRVTGGAEADMPLGYLVNLCASMLERQTNGTTSVKDSNRAVQLARVFVAAMDVQLASPYETMHIDYANTMKLLTPLAFADNVRSFPQLAPDSLVWIVSEFAERMSFKALSVRLTDIAKFAKGIFEATKGAHGLCFLDRSTTSLHSDLTADVLTQLLPKFSISAAEANAEYLLPEDVTKATLHCKPLVAVPDGYWIVEPTIAAHAFLIALLDFLKANERDAGAKVGLAVEALVRDYARARGLCVEHGIYSVDGEDGECDCIIETEHSVYFVECKYRDFHDESRTRDGYLLQDLRKALLEPLVQAGGHEVLLRSHGQLTLKREDGEYWLQLRNRRVVQIAITLSEFGSLQVREIVERLLTLSTGALWSSSDALVHSSLGTLRTLSKKLAQQHKALLALGVGTEDNAQPHFNCWGLSLSQFRLILDEVSPDQSFDDAMEKTRHVRSGTLDEYYERKRMRAPSLAQQQLLDFGRSSDRGFYIC